MSDDLAKRLREDVFYGDERLHNLSRHNPLHMQAADRIEELEKRNASLEAKLAKFEAMTMVDFANYLNVKNMTTLAELTGGKDE